MFYEEMKGGYDMVLFSGNFQHLPVDKGSRDELTLAHRPLCFYNKALIYFNDSLWASLFHLNLLAWH